MIYLHQTYPVRIFIYKGLNDKQFAKRLHKDSNGLATKNFTKTMIGIDSAGLVNSSKNNIVIRFTDKKPKPYIVVHETLHATFRIMEFVGLKLCDDSDEAFTYLQQELFNLIMKK